ncbi:MAG: hypothetical protein U9R34_05415 [Nanoarchaeota archaeon]|nr:hypothetical protein [Nanoarchaeota archaeon]
MINKNEWKKMRLELQAYDSKREELIKQSRVVLKKSKMLIYAIHRKDTKGINSLFKEVKKDKDNLDKVAKLKSNLLNEGSYSAACQEYVEAATFLEFKKCLPLSSAKKLGVSTSDYLMGLADLTGELARLAVAGAIKGDYERVGYIKDFVSELWGEMLEFDFRNSALRRKFDSIKYNLNKIEDIRYDIKMRK